MRFVLAVFLCAGLLAGCASKNSSAKLKPAATGAIGGKKAKTPPLAPTFEIVGKVVSVNVAVRFVVLEFPLSAMPALGQKMSVYRDGQKIGELKISGPQSENNIVADITAGDAQAGDEVRAD